VTDHLAAQGIPVEEGPVTRTGAISPLLSVYVRDPDGNLVEISNTVAWGARRPRYDAPACAVTSSASSSRVGPSGTGGRQPLA
jgi:hypothetical protein